MIDLAMYRPRTNTAKVVTGATFVLVMVVLSVSRAKSWWFLLALIPMLTAQRLAIRHIDRRGGR